VKSQITIHPTDHLETLRSCGGYYSCPKDAGGKRLGPLVGYAGTYVDPEGKKKQYVGDVYANFAKAEEYPWVLKHFAECMGDLRPFGIDAFCGAPYGGWAFSDMLGLHFKLPVTKAEKKVVALATATMREQSQLVFGRYAVKTNLRYGIVEDVCNNFSTTENQIKLIWSSGGYVVAIICLLNRSDTVHEKYYPKCMPSIGIPVVSLVRKVIPEYKQDDPLVAEDFAKGNVVLKPKDEWHRLVFK